ncbi:hypothetical protein GWI33_016051 [Rhynchophorus ferrugineus]|uniref:Uncharacterized protein n=1 Tax=Rhynchophorus ferrugineus TaxID=354439 RepID=A0A834M5C6_RHYFE|nr:hypothetical protein GWI33_016051 [Rhynchophorus ferrugineus]
MGQLVGQRSVRSSIAGSTAEAKKLYLVVDVKRWKCHGAIYSVDKLTCFFPEAHISRLFKILGIMSKEIT